MMKNLLPRILLVAVIFDCFSYRLAWAGGGADGSFDFPFPLPNSSLPVPSFTVEPNEPKLMPKLTEGVFEGNIIQKITVRGSTVYNAEELAKITAPFLGQSISTQADKKILDDAAQAITDRYRKDGYFLSYASTPQQSVSDGNYALEVTEGYVSEVVLEGEVGPVYSLLQSYLAQIPEKRPLNLSDAERYLQLARDVPGISLSSIFRRATGVSGGRELHVKVERRAIGGMINFDNRGTLIIGPGQALGRVYTDSNTFLGEHLEVLYSNSFDAQRFKFSGPNNALDQQHYVGVSTSVQIANDGLQFQLGGAYAQAKPGGPLNPDGTPDLNYLTTIGYKITNQSITSGFTYPIIRSSNLNLGTVLQFTMSNSLSRVTEVGTGITSVVGDSRFRAVRAGANIDFLDGFSGAESIALTAHQGLIIFGSSPAIGLSARGTGERTGAHANYTKFTLDVTSSRKIWVYDSGLINSLIYVGGQYALVALPASEQFSAGGQKCGRGYPAGRLSEILPTDHGYCFSTELQWSQDIDIDLPEGPIRPMFYTFFDFARGYAREAKNPFTGTVIKAAEPRNLASTGFGFRAYFPNRFHLDLEEALPVSDLAPYGVDPLPPFDQYGRPTRKIPKKWQTYFSLGWSF